MSDYPTTLHVNFRTADLDLRRFVDDVAAERGISAAAAVMEALRCYQHFGPDWRQYEQVPPWAVKLLAGVNGGE
jgi:hypothetical protein